MDRLDITPLTPREELIAYIDQLEFLLSEIMPKPADAGLMAFAFGLTKQQSLLIASLMNGRIWSAEQLATAISLCAHEITTHHVGVVMAAARAKLKPKGIRVENIFGVGWRMHDLSIARLKAALAGWPLEITPCQTTRKPRALITSPRR